MGKLVSMVSEFKKDCLWIMFLVHESGQRNSSARMIVTSSVTVENKIVLRSLNEFRDFVNVLKINFNGFDDIFVRNKNGTRVFK